MKKRVRRKHGWGYFVTLKSIGLIAVPPGVVTVTLPVAAPLGTMARIVVEDSFVILEVNLPLNPTLEASCRPDPLIVTCVPAFPLPGKSAKMRGMTLKGVLLIAVPHWVVTRIGPVVAFFGTTAEIMVDEGALNVD